MVCQKPLEIDADDEGRTWERDLQEVPVVICEECADRAERGDCLAFEEGSARG
jgi:hypothetical protein